MRMKNRRALGVLSATWRLGFVSLLGLVAVALCVAPVLAESQRCYCISGPDPVSACPGTTAVFQVSATGEGPLVYQWYHGTTPLTDGGDISGATTNELRISNVEVADAGEYSVLVTGPFGSVRSDAATLAVKAPTVVTDAPDPVSVCPGELATFSVTATGEGELTYQWYHDSVPLSDGGRVSGATSSRLQIRDAEADDAGDYAVEVTGECGAVRPSAPLVVKAPTVITDEPEDLSVCPDEVATFAVTASGEGTLTYQWYHGSIALTDGVRHSGTTDSQLTITGVESADAGQYTVEVVGGCGALISSAATLVVKQPTEISNQPDDLSLCPGATAEFAVTATGEGTLVYQWFHNSVPLEDGDRVSGARTNLLTIRDVEAADAGDYAVNVAGECGPVNSAVATLVVKAATAILEPPSAARIVDGTDASFTVVAAGEGPLAYQWFHRSTPLTDDGRITGATTDHLQISGATAEDAGAYSVTVTAECGKVSANTTLSVTPAIGTLEVVREPADLLIVLDLSSSMEEEVEGGVKIAVAKDALQQMLESLPGDMEVGLRTFHNCGRSNLETAIQPIAGSGILATIRGLDTFGTTPLAYTLQQIPGDLAGRQGLQVILFISDGAETCDGDPVAAARELSASRLNYIFKLVGFDVAGQGGRIRDQLQAIAGAAGGSFTEAQSAGDFLAAVLGLVLPPTYRVEDATGAIVKEGTAGDGPFELEAGVYTVTVDTDPAMVFDNIVIEHDGTVTLNVPNE